MIRIRGCIAACVALFASLPTMRAGEPLFTPFRESYFVTGIPLNTKPDYNTNDLAFQASFRLNILQDIGGKDWNIFLGYSQLSIWDVYKPSNPFRSSIYNPGLYVDHVFARNGDSVVSDILFGYEHKSNGYDSDLSRSIDHVFVTYTHTLSEIITLQLTGRFGIGSIGNKYSQEMYLKYQGYLNVGAAVHTRDRRLIATVSVTPLFKGDIPVNLSAELAFRPTRKIDWLYLTLRYHYGYDENQLDCAMPDVFLKQMLRGGLSVQPGRLSHKLLF